MSYTALYRKFRPDEFTDVKGQDAIVGTLKNQIMANRVGHAYLFCGTRGTGKTSIAKIFAKAVNCETPVEGSPCHNCKSCRTIAAGASMNVIEIDAASNNGVDNIREIVDEVSYSPAEGKYKVYIIDEVHMLSIGAFNALLKTLEEPPSYVIFILATTEVHKIPITILSRCQRYDFKRISIDTISLRLKELTDKEEVAIEEKALRFIAKTADGSMRDALSLLDQCIAFYYNKTLTYDSVLQVLGAVDTQVFHTLLEMILAGDTIGCISLLEKIMMQGRELTQFVTDFTWYLRNLMLCKSSEDIEDVIDVSSENLLRLKEQANQCEMNQIMRYIRVFSELAGQMKNSAQKRILLEMGLIRICKPQMEIQEDSLLERIRILEEKLEHQVVLASKQDYQSSSAYEKGNHGLEEKRGKKLEMLAAAVPDDVKQVVSNWVNIVGKTEMPMKQFLKAGKLSLAGDNRLMLVLEDGVSYDYFLNQDKKQIVEELIADMIGKKVDLLIQSMNPTERFEENYVDLHKILNIEVEIEE